MNTLYSATNIRFYVRCDAEYIDNDTYYDGVDQGNEFDYMVDTYFVAGALNIHFINTSDGTYGGLARLPTSSSNGYKCAVATSFDYISGATAGIMAHEAGHTFGLRHTHQGVAG